MRHSAVFLLSAFLACGGMYSGDSIPEDFRKQKVTVARIAGLGLRIADWQLQELGDIPVVSSLKENLNLPEERFHDGWGNELYFFSTGTHYVIVSFGRNGVPDSQVSEPGRPTSVRDYDADIVWIDGEWAQLPWGLSG